MIRIGVDYGGTKIEAAALDAEGRVVARVRQPNPGDYDGGLRTVGLVVDEIERQAGPCPRVGVATPGSVSPRTGMIRNGNSVWLNGRPFGQDLQRTLGRPVRLANDANCLALSEASDGAAAGQGVVFAAILGTGVGAGVVAGGRLIEGRNGVTGEWGHMPLPWPAGVDELPPLDCWCGLKGCIETYVSGTGLARDHERTTGVRLTAEQVVAAGRGGDVEAGATLDRYVGRLARAFAVIVDVLDPDVIVLGGGMSNVEALYERLPAAIAPMIFSDLFETPIVKALHGDSSGVRGAAWLWPLDEAGP